MRAKRRGKGLRIRMREKNSPGRKVFIVAMLAIPVLHWLVFWLYVNFSSFILAFQTPRTYEWTWSNFEQFWFELTAPGGAIGLAVINTLKYFALNIERDAGYYECSFCHHRYVPDFSHVIMAMHIGRVRLMKCPSCGKRTWQKKVLSR